MILSLLGVGFLLFGTSIKCLDNNNVGDSYSDNIDTNLRLNQPLQSYNDSGIRGLYNFKDTFSFSHNYSDTSVHFEDETYQHLVPLNLGESLLGYIRYISFDVSADENDVVNSIYVRIEYYFTENIDSQVLSYTILNGTDITYLSGLKTLIFNVQSSYFTEDVEDYTIFNEVFTTGINRYVTTYNGYYSFNSNPNFTDGHIENVLGTISINNSLYTYMSLFENSSQDSAVLQFGYFDVYEGVYSYQNYSFINATNWVLGVNNIYFNNCKMSLATYNRLSTLGIFGYIHDSTLDNITFHDFLFTLMDVPVYFITQFFNFELFGMNLAVAFAGLVTLTVMLCVVRIIMRLF